MERKQMTRSLNCSWLRTVVTIAVLVWLAAGSAMPAIAQPPQSPQRSARKVVVPPMAGAASSSAATNRSDSPDGATYVALRPGLEDVFGGREPMSVDELRLLAAQQSDVAAAIEAVTVNVQQGPAQGSGVIITPDGFVLTAAHVAGAPGREAWVVLPDGSRVRAETRGVNRDKDAGLLKIVEQRSEPWPHATLGESGTLREGQWVIAAGHPGGWKQQRGVVIRVGRILSIARGPVRRGSPDRSPHTLFTDCALIGGDSGGPLFTLEGKLVGIHSRIGTDVVDNMHVPIDVYAESWDRLVRNEAWGVLPGYQPVIGVSGTRNDDRPLIASVVQGGPAHRAGLEPGDLVLAVDGVKITTFAELRLAVENHMPGDVLRLRIQRGDQILQLPVTVGIAEN
ncbi:MAG: PDZ domain-containing protein [Planctomycetota bacterium]|nr:MAG: PDZ domain-containing protein [Planctomycetota bacterium]